MKKIIIIIVLCLILFTTSCTDLKEEEEIILPGHDISLFTGTEEDKIPVFNVRAPYSDITGYIDAFSKYQKKDNEFFLTFESSLIKTHQFIFDFDNIYPVDKIYFLNDNIPKTHIEISLDATSYTRIKADYVLTPDLNIIELNGARASSIRFIFDTDETYTIKDIYFTLALGVITKTRQDLFDAFYNLNGWTGGDGIFSFNLDGSVGFNSDAKKGFIFSDTLIGEVYPHNNLRKNMLMINNSIGYFDPTKPLDDAVSYTYDDTNPNAPKSVFEPDAYIGYKLRNLLDADGLNIGYDKSALLSNDADGTQYLTTGDEALMTIDLKSIQNIKSLYIWNYNETPHYGATQIEIKSSIDNETFDIITEQSINPATGLMDIPYTKEFQINKNARYIQININNSSDHIGLGKIMLFDQDENPLFGQITGTPEIQTLTDLDKTSRLWLQDGVVIDEYLYIHPILVKDVPGLFKVHSVGMIQVPIVADEIVYQDALFHQTPLQTRPPGGGEIFFGAGILNHTEHDGYIYNYGYKDFGGRNLIVARYKPEDILDFNQYEYYDGTSFQKDINQSAPIKERVSAELSVTYMEEGLFAGKFMLVVMENTTSGKVSYALSDTPYGPFNDYVLLYETSEDEMFRSAFTYNAKMQTTLSKPGHYIITYNVNANELVALQNARIYYPRFLEIIEVKRKD